jgi:hypothetical protein
MSRRYRAPEPDGDDLLTLLAEQESGPRACPHVFSVGVRSGHAWVHEDDPASDYYEEWVHSDPRCRRSAFPGAYKQPFPKMGWSRKLQKDVPL